MVLQKLVDWKDKKSEGVYIKVPLVINNSDVLHRFFKFYWKYFQIYNLLIKFI